MSAYIEFRDVKKIYKMGEVSIEALAGVDFPLIKENSSSSPVPAEQEKARLQKQLQRN